MKLENIYHWYTASGALVAELPPETELERLMHGLAPLGGLVCFDSSSAASDGPAYGVNTKQAEGDGSLDRFSFVAADPIEKFVATASTDPDDAESIREIVRKMKSRLAGFSCQTIPRYVYFPHEFYDKIGSTLLQICHETLGGSCSLYSSKPA